MTKKRVKAFPPTPSTVPGLCFPILTLKKIWLNDGIRSIMKVSFLET
jgi:hypothetical protein